MKRIALLALIVTLSASAQTAERGYWRAASKTAISITGDAVFTDEKLTIDFFTFPIAEIRPLTPAEIAMGFDGATGGTAHLYRLSIPADKKFLRKNTMCGGEETQWLATYVSGKELQLAFFSGSKMPVFTPEAMNSTNLCGTFSYVR